MIDVNEGRIDNGMPTAFDMRERRVDDMSSVMAMIPVMMASIIAALVVNSDNTRGLRLAGRHGRAGESMSHRDRSARQARKNGRGKRNFGQEIHAVKLRSCN
jgi:hypothetical protein